jgi:hypothetical protein
VWLVNYKFKSLWWTKQNHLGKQQHASKAFIKVVWVTRGELNNSILGAQSSLQAEKKGVCLIKLRDRERIAIILLVWVSSKCLAKKSTTTLNNEQQQSKVC